MTDQTSNNNEVIVDGRELSVREVVAVARGGRRAVLSDDPSVRGRMRSSVATRNELVERDIPLYGVTTGFGDSVDRQISAEKSRKLQEHLVDFLGAGTGDILPREYARAVMLVRANNLVRGFSAIRVEVVERLLEYLNRGIVAAIPEEGSVGASGDLVPLSYVAAALIGEREVHYEGEIYSAAEVLEREGLEPLELQAKEALALVNGTAYMTGIAAVVVEDARRLARLADACTALATEVLGSIALPFDSFIHDRAKPHAGQVRSARNIREFLEGSELVESYASLVEQTGSLEGDYRRLECSIQPKYSLRCAPQFTGVLWDATDWIEQWVDTEVNSANDNPLFDGESGRVFNGGNFAGGHMAMAMDSLGNAVASIADLLDRQLELVVDEKFNGELTPNLVPELHDDHPEKGLHHGFKGMQLACSSLTGEALNRTMPASAFSRPTEAYNQDKVSMGATAARNARDVVELAERVGSIHLIALCQAAELRGAERLGNTREVFDAVRRRVDFLDGDRRMDRDVQAVRRMLREGQLFDD